MSIAWKVQPTNIDMMILCVERISVLPIKTQDPISVSYLKSLEPTSTRRVGNVNIT